MNAEQTSIHALLRQAKILSHEEMVSLEKLIGIFGPMTSKAAFEEAMYYDDMRLASQYRIGDPYHPYAIREMDNYLAYAAILEKLEK